MVLQKIIYQVAKNLGKDVALREENNIWSRNDINLKEAGNVGSATLPSRFLEFVTSYTNIFYLWYFFISINNLFIIVLVRFPWELFSRMKM